MNQDPSVGRIVHYVLPASSKWPGEHRPAIVTQVSQPLSHESAPGMSNLTVFKGQSGDSEQEGASFMAGSVLFSSDPKPGTWHWPERV